MCLPCRTCSGDGKLSSFLDCPLSTLCHPKNHLKTRNNMQPHFPAGRRGVIFVSPQWCCTLGIFEELLAHGAGRGGQQPLSLSLVLFFACCWLVANGINLLTLDGINCKCSHDSHERVDVSYVGVCCSHFQLSLSSLEYSLI